MTEMPDSEKSDIELRSRLSRIDPASAGVPVEPVTSLRAQERVERIMQTLDTPSAPDELAARRRRRPLLVAAAAAAALVALVGGIFLIGGGLWGGTDPGSGGDDRPTTLALSAPPADAMNSCMVFSVDMLRDMPVALAGTVTAVETGSVTLDVDRWYRGGDADLVTIAVHDQNSVALDGVEFVSGGRYLVTATDGMVNGCGASGPANAQLESAYAEAFGG